jgi:tyramine---L-glutamate ligase
MKKVFVYEYLSGGGEHEAEQELLAMGLSMRDAMVGDLLAIDGLQVSAATCARVPAPPGGLAVSPQAREGAAAFVARQAALHDRVWLVAPETDGLLSRLHGVVQQAAPGRWLGCDAESIALTTAKRATLMRLARQGITTPLSFDGAPEVRRWIVKPDDGAGATATRVHRSQEAALDDWLMRSGAGTAMSIEPWVEGEPLSLSLLCRPSRCELLSINRQHIRIEGDRLCFDGVAVYAIGISDPRAGALRALAQKVARLLPGLRGFVGIDLVWHAQRGPVLIEINPRVTCAYVGLSALMKRNIAAELLDLPAPANGNAKAHIHG